MKDLRLLLFEKAPNIESIRLLSEERTESMDMILQNP